MLFRTFAVDITLKLMPSEVTQLEDEAERASEMLRGKVIAKVIRNRPTEVLLEFTDGTRLFVDRTVDALELSVTGGK
ncbi:hypothetical protein [Hylemonella gracilis]|uniref:hypothetical protein n=1 Tax=Hylemonella gracilis TaxID=80880 RepID=UPI00192A77FC|nr:hypothetical protein [Hylemonella gracilis]